MPVGLTLQGIPQVALTVPNIEDGIRFYQGTLGLPVLFKTPNMAALSCGDSRIILGTPAEGRPGQTTFLYFRVADMSQSVSALERAGVKIEDKPHKVGEFQGREIWLATFLDPAGTLHHLISEVVATNKPSTSTRKA